MSSYFYIYKVFIEFWKGGIFDTKYFFLKQWQAKVGIRWRHRANKADGTVTFVFVSHSCFWVRWAKSRFPFLLLHLDFSVPSLYPSSPPSIFRENRFSFSPEKILKPRLFHFLTNQTCFRFAQSSYYILLLRLRLRILLLPLLRCKRSER